jgi:dephospho-CoA kinase
MILPRLRVYATCAPSTRIIGLTGNIASGKSAVADMLAKKGATIIDADELSRDAVTPGSARIGVDRGALGPSVLSADGTLDRAALRKTVFNNRSELDALNEIVHPEVIATSRPRGRRRAMRAIASFVAVIPLLFERHLPTNSISSFSSMLLVTCDSSGSFAIAGSRKLKRWT